MVTGITGRMELNRKCQIRKKLAQIGYTNRLLACTFSLDCRARSRNFLVIPSDNGSGVVAGADDAELSHGRGVVHSKKQM